jgi:hypothetical protein
MARPPTGAGEAERRAIAFLEAENGAVEFARRVEIFGENGEMLGAGELAGAQHEMIDADDPDASDRGHGELLTSPHPPG